MFDGNCHMIYAEKYFMKMDIHKTPISFAKDPVVMRTKLGNHP